MNLKVIHIPNSPLGNTVELREMTMRDFVSAQKTIGAKEEGLEVSLEYLSKMLYVDNQRVTSEQLGDFGMSAVLPLLSAMNKLMPQEEEGKD